MVLRILAADEPARTDDVDSVVVDVHLHVARPVPGAVGIGVHERLAYSHKGYLGYLVARTPARDDDLATDIVSDVVLSLVDEGEDSTRFLAQVECLSAHVGLEDAHLELDVNRRAKKHFGGVGEGAIRSEEPQTCESALDRLVLEGDPAVPPSPFNEPPKLCLLNVRKRSRRGLAVPRLSPVGSLKDHGLQHVRFHEAVLVGHADAVDVLTGVGRVGSLEGHADVVLTAVGEPLDSGVDRRRYRVGYSLADLTQRTVRDLLSNDVTIVQDPKVEGASAMLVEDRGHGDNTLLELSGGSLVLDQLGLGTEVHVRLPSCVCRLYRSCPSQVLCSATFPRRASPRSCCSHLT